MKNTVAQWNTKSLHNDSSDLPTNGNDYCARYCAIRHQSEVICAALHADDFNLQGMPETSPPKWHLAHTTWFFETFVLAPFVENYQPYNAHFSSLFNSYYNGTGTAAFPRAQRGLLSRPTISEVFNYRSAIDQQIIDLLHRNRGSSKSKHAEAIAQRIELGLHHEQQHQELLLTDIKYSFSLNPLLPVFCNCATSRNVRAFPLRAVGKLGWVEFKDHLAEIGADPAYNAFYFDNEAPRHQVFIHPFALGERLITNGEYLEFIGDSGYQRPELWLADGWRHLEQNQWQAPLYWRRQGQSHNGRDWSLFTLHGEAPLDLDEPVCHVNYYEADAYARWAGARLPTEAEWESAASTQLIEGHFIDDGVLHPRPAGCTKHALRQLFGDVWEWTASAYAPYPGYKPPSGALGEYNGKFMCNQMVLRGGSCVSPRGHLRASYRNFFYPADRWQFSGIRLARSLG